MPTTTTSRTIPVIAMDNPPSGAVPATIEQLLALGIPQESIDAGKHSFETITTYPWGHCHRLRAIVEFAEFGQFSSKKWVQFFPMRAMSSPREDGYCMRGYVSVGGVKYKAFTSSQLFELPCGKLVDVAVIFASRKS